MLETRFFLGSALALVLAAPGIAQEQDFSAVQIRAESLGNGLFVLFGSGGNIALSTGADGSVLVDTQYAPLNQKIVAAVRAAGGSDVKYVINTHWHGDHAGGNEPLGRAGAVIIAHDNVHTRLSTEQFVAAFNQRIPPAAAAAWPAITYPNRSTFHFNGHTVNVVHVANAHTDGDSLVHFTNSNVIHTGDAYVKDQYPFIDISSGGSIDGFIGAAHAVLARSDTTTRIIPGHGEVATKADVQRFHDMLVAVRRNVQTLIDQGRSEDEVVTAKPTAEFDTAWGVGFMNPENFTRFAYQSLKR